MTALWRVSVRVPSVAAEELRAAFVALAPQGFEEREAAGGVELALYVDADRLENVQARLPGASVEPVPDGWEDAWRVFHRPVDIEGIWIGPPWEIPPDPAHAVVIDPGRAFGTGAHPTTRACLEMLLDFEPAGGFADLGCGAGVLAIAAAQMGFAPVFAIDHEARSVEATVHNAERNGVTLQALQLDLLTVDPPPAPTIAANMPPDVHRRVAARLAPDVVRVIVSGVTTEELDDVLAAYARAGLEPVDDRGGAWRTVLLERPRD